MMPFEKTLLRITKISLKVIAKIKITYSISISRKITCHSVSKHEPSPKRQKQNISTKSWDKTSQTSQNQNCSFASILRPGKVRNLLQSSKTKIKNSSTILNLLKTACIAMTAHGCEILNHQSMPMLYSSLIQEISVDQMEVIHNIAASTSRINNLNLVDHSSYSSGDLQSKGSQHLCKSGLTGLESNPQQKDHTFLD